MNCCAALPVDDTVIDCIWRQYKRDQTDVLRTRLIVHYMRTHVRRIAERMHATLPSQVELDDLVQQGYLGLVDSIERFELDRNVRFETFSARRIFGAMRDYLRAIDPMPRLARDRAKQLDAAHEAYFKRHGKRPPDELLRERLQLSRQKFSRLLATGRPLVIGYHGGRNDDPDEDSDAMEGFEDRRQSSPLTDAEKKDLRSWVTAGFGRRDHLIIVLYYYEQMTMREVGQALGISESRVSQRLESIVQCLRARMSFSGAAAEFV